MSTALATLAGKLAERVGMDSVDPIKYKEDVFFLRKNKDLLQELSGTIDVIVGSRFIKELKESRSFSRVEISESELWGISNNPVNHAHQRNPNKKWS
ncbi:hypothetical protein BZL33_13755 [Escherichia coli]|nr:hypothetical protein [Escherichia coli]OUK51954.1 hypothetical protein BZL33_13755 [Escherichia coli]